jgi:hypothetical protein
VTKWLTEIEEEQRRKAEEEGPSNRRAELDRILMNIREICGRGGNSEKEALLRWTDYLLRLSEIGAEVQSCLDDISDPNDPDKEWAVAVFRAAALGRKSKVLRQMQLFSQQRRELTNELWKRGIVGWENVKQVEKKCGEKEYWLREGLQVELRPLLIRKLGLEHVKAPYSPFERRDPSVILGETWKDPAFVRGVKKKFKAPNQFKVIKALLAAGSEGLDKDKLEEVASGARTILRELRKDADWKAVIDTAQVKGGGYRLKD